MKEPITIILMACVFLPTILGAQYKYETESFVDESEVPEMALLFIKKINEPKKLKWYREQSSDGLSYEAKFNKAGNKYSIEFNTDGDLEDAEILSSWKKLDRQFRSGIRNDMENRYSDWKIVRLQKQFSGPAESVLNFINSGYVDSTVLVRFEIVARLKDDEKYVLKELLYSNEATIIKERILIFQSIDNLEF